MTVTAAPGAARAPSNAGDPVAELAGLVTGLDSGLDVDAVRVALGWATVRATGQRRVARAVLVAPDLLTGAGHQAPTPAVLRFIDELVAAGAATVTRPACPRCHLIPSSKTGACRGSVLPRGA